MGLAGDPEVKTYTYNEKNDKVTLDLDLSPEATTSSQLLNPRHHQLRPDFQPNHPHNPYTYPKQIVHATRVIAPSFPENDPSIHNNHRLLIVPEVPVYQRIFEHPNFYDNHQQYYGQKNNLQHTAADNVHNSQLQYYSQHPHPPNYGGHPAAPGPGNEN